MIIYNISQPRVCVLCRTPNSFVDNGNNWLCHVCGHSIRRPPSVPPPPPPPPLPINPPFRPDPPPINLDLPIRSPILRPRVRFNPLSAVAQFFGDVLDWFFDDGWKIISIGMIVLIIVGFGIRLIPPLFEEKDIYSDPIGIKNSQSGDSTTTSSKPTQTEDTAQEPTLLPYFSDSFLSTTRLSNSWIKTNGNTWVFDGDNGLNLAGSSGYLVLSDLPVNTHNGYVITFQARGCNENAATLAWVYLGMDENNTLVDGLSFINGSDISYHASSKNVDNFTKICDLTFTRTDRFVAIKLQFVSGKVKIYVNGEHFHTQELKGTTPAFSFYRGNKNYNVKNFNVYID